MDATTSGLNTEELYVVSRVRERVRHFLSLSGIDRFAKVYADGVADDIKKQFATQEGNLDENHLKARELMLTTIAGKQQELASKIEQIYLETFSVDELEALIAFYSSPVGKRIVEFGGIILPAAQKAGEEWCGNVLKGIDEDLAKLLS